MTYPGLGNTPVSSPSVKTQTDHTLLFSATNLRRLTDQHWQLRSEWERDHCEPWNKSDLVGVTAYIPLQLYTDKEENLGRTLNPGDTVGLTAAEDRLPVIKATVSRSSSELTSSRAPLQVILTIGGSKENPVYGLIFVKAYLNNFDVKKGRVFCGRDDYPGDNEFPVPCTLGNDNRPKQNTGTSDTAASPGEKASRISHDLTLLTPAGLPNGEHSLATACKIIPSGALGTEAFNGQKGFVVKLPPTEGCVIKTGTLLGYAPDPSKAPVDAIAVYDDINLAQGMFVAIFAKENGTFEAYPVPNARDMALVNNDLLRVANVGPKFASTETLEFSVASMLQKSVNDYPWKQCDFALMLTSNMSSVDALAAHIPNGHSTILFDASCGLHQLHGNLALMVGATQVGAVHLTDPVQLENGNCQIGVSVTPEGIKTQIVPGDKQFQVPKLLCSQIYPNTLKQ